MPFDAAATTDLQPGFRPGERMVAGRPYVFSLKLLNAYLADRAIEQAPADLTTLSDEEVSMLWGAWLDADGRRRREVEDFGLRINEERASRPALYAAYRAA